MREIFGFLGREIAQLWHKPWVGLGVAVTLGAAVTLRAGQTAVGFVFGFFTFGAVFFIWYEVHRIGKTPSNKVGFIVAISSDQEEESKRIEADFIETLRGLLTRNDGGSRFHLIVARRFIADAVNEKPELSTKYLEKARALFMLFGRARKRLVEGKETHVLNLECGVRHAPVPVSVSKAFAADLAQALPRRVMLPEDSSVIGFEITSQLVDLAARYAIATAAFVSGFLPYAEALFLDVETQLHRFPCMAPGVQQITRVLPVRFKELYASWLQWESDCSFKSRAIEHVRNCDKLAEKLLARDECNYAALLAKASGDFLLRQDVPAAKRTLQKCANIPDGTWRYGMAFLLAYEEDLEAAYDMYRDAFRRSLENPRTATECEEFIQIVLEKEPAKTHLYFCLGLINYNAKNDYLAAEKDFKIFLNSPTIAKFPFAREKAEQLLQLIQQKGSHQS